MYDVFWDSGPLDVTAGHRYALGTARQRRLRWRRAETATWVDSFFRASDRFLTTADRELLPLEHVREPRGAGAWIGRMRSSASSAGSASGRHPPRRAPPTR